MSDIDDKGTTTEPRTFTQDEVNRFLAEDRRRTVAKYADYDELKQRAASADADKSKIDKILQSLEAAEKRAAAAEAATMRREVADELGLSVRQVGRLQGTTREELLADGREFMQDMGIKPKSAQNDSTSTAGAGTETNGSGAGQDDDDQQTQQQEPQRQAEPVRRTRPREDLQSGAPRTETKPEETDPLKLAALIPRR